MGLQDLTPRLRTRLQRVERIVGLFVGLAALALVGGFAYYLYFTAARKGWFVPKTPYYTFLHSAAGIGVGDPIDLAGFSVGEVTLIDTEPPGAPYPVFLAFRIRRPYYGYVWSDSEVRITTAELFGRRKIEVTAGREGSPTVREQKGRAREVLIGGRYVPLDDAPKGPFVPPAETPALTERAEQLLAQVEAALPGILALADDARRTLGNADRLATRLDELARAAEPVAEDLATITARLRDPKGSLGEWLLPPDLRTRLVTTLDTSQTHLDAVATRLGRTLDNLAAMTGTLNAQVQANDQILAHISELVVETDALVAGLKRHWLLRGAFPRSEAESRPVRLAPEIAPPAGP
jgi:ABC-type transporter Mla subunit MlaD